MQYYIVSESNGLTLNVGNDNRRPVVINTTTGDEPHVWIKEQYDECTFKLKHENGNYNF